MYIFLHEVQFIVFKKFIEKKLGIIIVNVLRIKPQLKKLKTFTFSLTGYIP